MSDLYTIAWQCLMAAKPTEKVRLTREAAQCWRDGLLSVDPATPVEAFQDPGRPDRPRLVEPKNVPHRSIATPHGQAALIHAIAHIEFNAINLAWDAVYRFREMPDGFRHDWIRVADEEAYHFTLLTGRLQRLGYHYGDFDAHDGLWDVARDTAHDVLERMALVPRVLEARGLDATPKIMRKLAEAGDPETVAILEIILHDEIGHVEIGSRWFRYACDQRGLDSQQTFRQLLQERLRGRIRGPLHLEARRQAGFSEEELTELQAMID
jgi:uncharacterized ferritin-like protein (DUF455 family)